jgi:ectoine hydroxylase-related dioxygenase (phytanoyl-CoA dioxygenase family)
MATVLTQPKPGDPLRAEFERRGYIVLPRLFDAAEMREITAWVDDLQSRPETPGKQWMYFEQSKDTPRRRLLNRIENFVPFHDGLARLVQSDRMLGIASRVLGGPAVLFKDKINFKLPGGGGFEPHQDVQAGWDDYANIYVTAMVSIDETTIENGCLELAEWPHKREMIGQLWKPLGEAETKGIAYTTLPTKPGDAVFFDSFLPHRSQPNPTRSARRVLYITYNLLAEGDQRVRYYADKHRNYPPDCEREPGKAYEYKV